MSVLTSGRTEPCKDSAGGVKELWLSTFVDYPVFLIAGYKNMLLTSFPTTQFYRYEGQGKTFSEQYKDQTGYDQEINIILFKQDYLSAALMDNLVKNKTRAVVIDRNGRIRVAGLHNGLDVEVTAKSGGSRFDLNGYEVKITGSEPFSAPYLSVFPGAGFVKEGVILDCLLCSSDRPASLMDKISSCNIVT